ncbi:zinc finger CCHC domain-containing protein 4 [Platysternon megacephalum]|uniref:Zinc finger CCHC domain-containing protein 4 n=1 Tax=Platysternon megacephalum TaxID=55544 RepID=A0A4D9F422_9SAUR|nr:zinc finger CCHC domain-containing protein 4 [Platysternon megacephalum]
MKAPAGALGVSMLPDKGMAALPQAVALRIWTPSTIGSLEVQRAPSPVGASRLSATEPDSPINLHPTDAYTLLARGASWCGNLVALGLPALGHLCGQAAMGLVDHGIPGNC